MNDQQLRLYQGIVENMTEGVLACGNDGTVLSMNDACIAILGLSPAAVGQPLARVLFSRPELDPVGQAVLDAVYGESVTQRMVEYAVGRFTRRLRVTTSCLREDGRSTGVLLVVEDMTDLMELADAVVAMEKIRALNVQLEARNRLIHETFGRYLSDEIVHELLDTPDGARLGGEKKRITVLMSDLRGFTALSERMAPVDLMRMLNGYLADMTEIIQRHSGTIIEFIGDAILAIFGEPLHTESPERECALCAVEMQRAMPAVCARNRENGYPPLEMGIGIHTGEAVLGNIGSIRRAKYGVVGETVNLSGRIESCTVGRQILLSEACARCIPDLVTRGSREIAAKGIARPVTLLDVLAVGDTALAEDEAQLLPPDQPLTLNLQLLDGKLMTGKTLRAQILACSKREALTDIAARPGDNVRFELDGQECYGKFTSENRLRLTFGEFPVSERG